ncbi:HIRAN domain-containing protein [Azonexus sp.]|uniref:HIRAN domain-containing protein n=1 Tax=Azonexus sp. TaxID=1872668 RepID=UPI0039E52DFF
MEDFVPDSPGLMPSTDLPDQPFTALPPPVRASLWLTAEEVRAHDGRPRLWLHLRDGRVLAFMLPRAVWCDAQIIAQLAAAVAADQRGLLHTLELPEFGSVQLLYAAPVLPLPIAVEMPYTRNSEIRDRGTQRGLARHDLLLFMRGLDIEVLGLLGSLSCMNFLSSVRNYNRLAVLPPGQHEAWRTRRLQALRRFLGLLTPLLLTEHRHPNVCSGKRHAWRHPDPAVEAAIDNGRDLTGALAEHYAISRALVRSPMNAGLWAAGYETRGSMLRFIDALPANKRPASADEMERYKAELLAFRSLFTGDAPDAGAAAHVSAFHLGWRRTWEICTRRFSPVTHALVDAGDFFAAVRRRAAVLLNMPRGPRHDALVGAWLARHGLVGVLAASARWHRLLPPLEQPLADRVLPAVLGDWQNPIDSGWRAQELCTAAELVAEGQSMQHCAATYWSASVQGGRMFSLCLNDGERATAFYVPRSSEGVIPYYLAQLRGPANAAASPLMLVFADALACALNAPERHAARERAVRWESTLLCQDNRRQHTAWLDPQSERQLQHILSAHEGPQENPARLLIAAVAGYTYYASAQREDGLTVGAPLQLVREPENPHDCRAVRLDWRAQPLGYVPRAQNARIAALLDAGESLSASIIEIAGRHEDAWERLWFSVERVEKTHTDTTMPN